MSESLETKQPMYRVGCADLPSGLSRRQYFERVAYLETSTTFLSIPKASILRRWLRDSNGVGRFGLLAPRAITHTPSSKGYANSRTKQSAEAWSQMGGLRDTSVIREEIATLSRACEELNAEAVIFRTPASFSPSQANRDRLTHFFEHLASADQFEGATRVWEPQGLWEPSTAAKLADRLNITLSCDPLSNDPLEQDPDVFAHLPSRSIYFRVTGLGSMRQRFLQFDLDRLMLLCESYEQAWVVFANSGKYPDAIKLRRMMANPQTANP